ncbi:gas vesicle K [Cereibacter sphaeroides WS8N]|uniref:gas vesicle protein K n=1 Tax=Cereibacter sphaeroides TaxID=1063 RepID=UPI00020B013C|nr:gas vesicle protein K [Cereibacter sphaeroides]EGJ20358.1 gas vesicle K [Cereibacter sphaeroides WS8N]
MTYPFPPLLLRDDRLPPTEAPVTAPRIALDPDRLEHDLARILLGLMEMLRQIMELQAIRRMEASSLSESQQEQLGTTLMRAEAAIHEMAARFGLTPADLSLDLGPLGRTI